MMLTNPSMKDKYPYWWANKEKQEREQELERMIEAAEWRLSQFVDEKMKDIDSLVREIENRLQNMSYNAEGTFNGLPMNSSTINREIKKMVISEFHKALR